MLSSDAVPSQRLLASTVAAWLAFLAIDFLLHAVLLAPWWSATANYWLPPAELFRRIPFAYASFALYCGVLAWLLVRLFGGRPPVAVGARVGAMAGIAFGVSAVLGIYSVFRTPASVLLVWTASYGIESAVAGAVVCWVLRAARPWRRVGAAFGGAVLVVILGIILQNTLIPANAG